MCSSARRLAVLALGLLAACGKKDSAAATSTGTAEARKLIAEAGFPEGRGFPKLEVLYNTDEYHRQIAAAIQEMWRVNLGVSVELRNVEFPVMMGMVQQGEFQIARQGYIGEYSDPLAFLELFTEDSRSNSTGWRSKDYESLAPNEGDDEDLAQAA